MSLFQSLTFGVIQGLTEPLPISSSAHLLLVSKWLGWQSSLAFDAALHVGTALALFLFFWREWVALLKPRGLFSDPTGQDFPDPSGQLGKVVIGVIPAVVAGLLFEEIIETHLRTSWVVATALVLVGGVMWLASRLQARRACKFQPVGLEKAVGIGLAQVLALIPGVSRSGVTISVGMLLGLASEEAFTFSFLMGAPLTLGAGAFSIIKLLTSTAAVDWASFAVGIGSSFVVGWFALWLFRRIFSRFSLVPFVIYRFLLAILILLSLVVR